MSATELSEPRILLISPYFPRPDSGHGGGDVILNTVRGLARETRLTLVAFSRESDRCAVPAMEDLCERVLAIPFPSAEDSGVLDRIRLVGSRLAASAWSSVNRTPYYVQKYRQPAMERCLRELAREPFDAVVIEFFQMAPYATLFQGHRGLLALETHEINTVKQFGQFRFAPQSWRKIPEGLRTIRWVLYETRIIDIFDLVLCMTEQDCAVLRALTAASHVDLLAPGIDTEKVLPRRTDMEVANSILFVGSYDHPPNVDAAELLLDSIFPAIQRRLTDARLTLVGKNPPRSLREKAKPFGDKVHVLGFVDDLGAEFSKHSLFLAPVRFAGGIKIKNLDAMAREMPVLTTPRGAEGIAIENGIHALVAATEEELVEAALSLLPDQERRRELGREARLLIEDVHSAEATLRGYRRLLKRGNPARQRKRLEIYGEGFTAT